MDQKYACDHIIKNSESEIDIRTFRCSWFTKCVACDEPNIFSYEMFECSECKVFIHKRCWKRFLEFARTCIVVNKSFRRMRLRENNSAGPDENVDASDTATVATQVESAARNTNQSANRIRKLHAETRVDSKMALDPVTALQELCKVRRWKPPRYELVEPGIRTLRLFDFNCRIKDYCVTGEGPSKKAAKRQAAIMMYHKAKNNN